MPHDVIAIGAAHVDHLARATRTFVPAASNPGRIRTSVGGAAFNAAWTLRALGARTVLVSARAGDAAGERVAQRLGELGIEDAGITWLDRRTPSYTAVFDDLGDLAAAVADMELYELLTARALSRRHIRDRIQAATAILLDANLPERTIRAIVDQAAGQPIAALGVSPAKVERLRPVLPLLDAVFLSRLEAASLAEAPAEAGGATALAMLADRGLRRAVVTDGPRSALIWDGSDLVAQAPQPVRILHDVTGAGDTLAGATFLAVCEGAAFVDAARLGMAAAASRLSSPAFDVDARAACQVILATMAPPLTLARR